MQFEPLKLTMFAFIEKRVIHQKRFISFVNDFKINVFAVGIMGRFTQP